MILFSPTKGQKTEPTANSDKITVSKNQEGVKETMPIDLHANTKKFTLPPYAICISEVGSLDRI